MILRNKDVYMMESLTAKNEGHGTQQILTGCLRNMNIFTNRGLKLALVYVCGIALLTACHGRHTRVSDEEYRVVETATNTFVRDWGMPSYPEGVPKRCYLRDSFVKMSDLEEKALDQKKIDAGRAIQDLKAKPVGGALSGVRSPCALVKEPFLGEDPWNAHNSRESRIGILQVTRVGIDERENVAIILLSESRADIAGSTWAIVFRRIANNWVITSRTILTAN